MQQLLIIFSYLELIISRYTIIISKWVARISFRSKRGHNKKKVTRQYKNQRGTIYCNALLFFNNALQ